MSAPFDDLSRPLGLPAVDPGPRHRAAWKIGLVVTLCSAALFGAGALHLRTALSPAPPASVAMPQQADAAEAEHVAELSPVVDDGTPVVRAGFPPQMPEVTGTIARPPGILSAGLSEAGRFGMLPRIALDGTRPGDAYARSRRPDLGGRPKLALVVEPRTVDPDAVRAAVRLPGDVTLSLGAAQDAESVAERLRREGREVWLRVPMEPLDYPLTDPGPRTLTTTATAAENRHGAVAGCAGQARALLRRQRCLRSIGCGGGGERRRGQLCAGGCARGREPLAGNGGAGTGCA